ncbi:MAG: TIGR00730 family Rossman fold protein [Candidatus Binatia bacterium]
MRRVCIFCGSNNGARSVYVDAARAMGTALARRRVGLVYGGGRVGLMGVVADAVMTGGGEVIGVIPEALVAKEVAHEGLPDLRVVGSMHERKALMTELADAFVALPGGYGTLEEFCEVVTWAQLGLHRKPCGLLNVGGFYDRLLALFDHAVAEHFVRPAHRSLVLEERDPERLLDLLAGYQPLALEKWIDRDET